MTEEQLKSRFTALGQGHLFACWRQRPQEQKARLLDGLAGLDLGLLAELLAGLKGEKVKRPRLEPAAFIPRQQWRGNAQACSRGEALIAAGRVGFLTAAGGQGSRLGFAGPKGMFPISPLRRATLFQLFAEKILASQRRYGTPAHWYIMTSSQNHGKTLDYFQEKAFFGLSPETVHFFTQQELPTLSEEGTLILAEDGGLFTNPNGHGGVISALRESGLCAGMRARGLEELFYFQVDNPLVDLPDPAFLGIHLGRGAQMSTKVIAKAYPEEKLGTIGLVDGRPGIIEYSDLDAGAMQARSEQGGLLYSHGSIAVHLLNVAFLAGEDLKLPLHQARKKVRALVPTAGGGEVVEREAVKFELFIFDAIPQARNPLFCETDREEEFAALKNKSGADSIDTCQQGLIEKSARWLEACGVEVPRDARGKSLYRLEISPLYALDQEELKSSLKNSVNRISEDTLFS